MPFSLSPVMYRKRLVLLGTGWGCYSVLKNINKKLYDVIVVSPRNHFLFTPLLNSTTVGTLEFRSIIESIRNTKFRDDHHFQLAEAIQLNPHKKSIVCKGVSSDKEYTLSYDKVVIGVGAVSNTFGIPGVQDYAYFLKEIADARRIRNQIITNFEQSLFPYVNPEERRSLLHFVIVGGGPTGVEFGAELYDFITNDIARLFPGEKNDVHVTLVEGDSILPSFDQRLRKFAEKKITQRENFHLIKDFVVEVGENYVKLKSGKLLLTKLVVWSTGLGPRKFIECLDLPKGKSKQLKVDDHLRVVGYDNIFAIGDCSYIEGSPLPSTAQVAERQGRYVAQYLSLIETNPKTESKPFLWSNAGMLAYIGGYKAVADLPTKAGKLTGFKSWLIWRSVYLTRLGSWRNRMQVPFDWARTFFLAETYLDFKLQALFIIGVHKYIGISLASHWAMIFVLGTSGFSIFIFLYYVITCNHETFSNIFCTIFYQGLPTFLVSFLFFNLEQQLYDLLFQTLQRKKFKMKNYKFTNYNHPV